MAKYALLTAPDGQTYKTYNPYAVWYVESNLKLNRKHLPFTEEDAEDLFQGFLFWDVRELYEDLSHKDPIDDPYFQIAAVRNECLNLRVFCRRHMNTSITAEVGEDA